jgi:hypothetical protein
MLGFINKDYADLLKEHPEPEYQDVAGLCYMTVVANLGQEIIDTRANPGAKEKRYAEIEEALGPRMVKEVQEWVERYWPPYCSLCGGEGHGPEGENEKLDVYSSSRCSTTWTNTSCTEKLHAEWSENFYQELLQYFAGEHEFDPGTNGAAWAMEMKKKVEADPSLLLQENRAKFDSELKKINGIG